MAWQPRQNEDLWTEPFHDLDIGGAPLTDFEPAPDVSEAQSFSRLRFLLQGLTGGGDGG